MRRSCSLSALMLIAFLAPVPRCLWGVPSAPVVTLTAPSTYAVLQFLLRVSVGLHAPVDSVTVTVDPNHNNLPTADAGPDLSGVSAEAMSVTGSGSDPDGAAVSFTWLQLTGTTEAPSIDLIDADQATLWSGPVRRERSGIE